MSRRSISALPSTDICSSSRTPTRGGAATSWRARGWSCSSINRRSSTRCRSAPETRPSACSDTSRGTPTIRRRSIPSAISSRARSGSSPRYLGVPQRLIEKAPTADLEADQTDEADLGISYARADAILAQLLLGYSDEQLVERGFSRRGSRARSPARRLNALEAPSCRRPRCSATPRSTSSTSGRWITDRA